MNAGSLVFGRYQLAERIDAGGRSETWRAIDLILDQVVALKRIRVAAVGDEQATPARERALSGARLAARLRRHPHVVATYDVRVDGADIWLVLEYVPSRSLAQILRENGPLDPGQAARIGAQLADALAAAHVVGIAHHGVAPGNVLITEDGTAKLTNFGISGPADGTQPETSGPASDVLALGSTLYTAVAGQPPSSTGAGSAAQLAAGALSPLLVRLLEPDPTTRPDAGTARELLDQFAIEVPGPALVPASTRLPRRWWSRPQLLIAAMTMIVAVALAGGTSRAGARRGDFATLCGNALVLANRTVIWIDAQGPAPDLCAVTEAGTLTAVNALAREGIRYRPDRASGWSLARSDACEVLDSAALSKIADLDVGSRSPGFAHWRCTWGTSDLGSPQVFVLFRLDEAATDGYGNPTTIAGRRAWLHPMAGANNLEACQAFVVHRPAPTSTSATEILEVDVDAPGLHKDVCPRAAELAAAGEARLPPPP